MKIADIRASVHRFETVLPLVDKPAGDSLRVICEVETDDGIVGVGMAARFLCHGVAASVVRHLFPAIKGMDPRDLEAIHARLRPLISERGMMSGINLGLSQANWHRSGQEFETWGRTTNVQTCRGDDPQELNRTQTVNGIRKCQ